MGYGMLWGVEYEERKRRKKNKRWERKAVCCRICIPLSQPELNEERLSHFRELNSFKIRGSAGQKAPL